MLSKQNFTLLILFLFLCKTGFTQTIQDPDPTRFKKEIDNFSQWDAKNSFPENAILFVGSSSIRFWKSHEGFPGYPIINRGFGGSHISDVQYYYDKVIGKYHPWVIVFYAGDNDIAGNKPVQQVVNDYKELTNHILNNFPDVKFIYVPIKPSSSRWSYWDKMKEVNRQVKVHNEQNDHLYYIDLATPILGPDGKPNDSIFRNDHLHLNDKGYAIWNRLLAPELKTLYNQ